MGGRHFLGMFVLIAIGYVLAMYWPAPGAFLRSKIG